MTEAQTQALKIYWHKVRYEYAALWVWNDPPFRGAYEYWRKRDAALAELLKVL